MENFIIFLENISKNKFYPYLRMIVRGVLQYSYYGLCYSLTALLLRANFSKLAQADLPFPNLFLIILLTALAYFLLNTVLLSFAIFNKTERELFFNSTGREAIADDAELLQDRLLSSRVFWVELGTMIVCCFLFPVWHGYEDLVELNPFLYHLPPILHRLLLTLIFAIAAWFLLLNSRMGAMKYWLRRTKEEQGKRGHVAVERVNQTAYKPVRLIFRLLGLGLMYGLGTRLVCYLLPTLWSLGRIIWMIFGQFAFWLLIILIFGLFWGRVFWKRALFYIRLIKTCHHYGFRILSQKRIFLSILFPQKAYQFAVEANKKVYCCRLISFFVPGTRMHFFEDGSYERIFDIHTPMPLAVSTRYGAMMLDRGNGDDRTLFAFRRKSVYQFDCETSGKKIIILNPVPKRVILGKGQLNDADNGDRIGEYAVYSGGAFLRALKRDGFDEN